MFENTSHRLQLLRNVYKIKYYFAKTKAQRKRNAAEVTHRVWCIVFKLLIAVLHVDDHVICIWPIKHYTLCYLCLLTASIDTSNNSYTSGLYKYVLFMSQSWDYESLHVTQANKKANYFFYTSGTFY